MDLVTGTSSGLGRYLKNALSAMPFIRGDSIEKYKAHQFEAIIHCGYNVSRNCSTNNIDQYVADNFLQTQALLGLNFKKFIFISSSDIYPCGNQHPWEEEANFECDLSDGLYPISKRFTESMIKAVTNNYVIIRPTAMLGSDARPNSVMKILSGASPTLTLSPDSMFNYVLHEDILLFIKVAIEKNLVGIFNAASNNSIQLGQIAETYKLPVKFGTYTYQGRDLSNVKIKAFANNFDKTSFKSIQEYYSSIRRA